MGDYTPWSFPFDKVPDEHSITTPPIAESSAIARSPQGTTQHKKKRKIVGVIALGVGGTAFIITLVALAVAFHNRRNHAAQHESLSSSRRSMCSFPVSSNGGDHYLHKFLFFTIFFLVLPVWELLNPALKIVIHVNLFAP